MAERTSCDRSVEKKTQPAPRRSRRLLNRLARYASFPVRAGRVFANEGVGGCLDRIRRRLHRESIEMTPERRYAQWRAQNETGALPDISGLGTRRVSVIVLSVEPSLERLNAVLHTWAGQCAALPAVDLCVIAMTQDSAVRNVLTDWPASPSDAEFRFVDNPDAFAESVNALVRESASEFLVMTDTDCVPAENALVRLIAAQLADPQCGIVYGDDDQLDEAGNRVDPFFKPDLSPELLHSLNYVGSNYLMTRALYDRIGGIVAIPDRAYAYDLLLRALDDSPRVHHTREILFHGLRKSSEGPLQPVSSAAALSSAFARRGVPVLVTAAGNRTECRFERVGNPLVSIIIPSDNAENSIECISRLLARTGYRETEILLVTNSRVARVVEPTFSDRREVRCVRYDRPFNFSDKCNAGANAARGEYLVFFNDDVAPLSRDWIEKLLEYAQQPGIGGVSPRMLYENGTIQYAGMVTGVRDFVGTSFHCWEPDDERYHGLARCVRNVSVLCGACMMVSRSAFDAIGGWDAENTPIAHSDLTFSFALSEYGYRMVFTPLADMSHVGAKSRHDDSGWRHLDDEAHDFVLRNCGPHLSDDPFFPAGMRAMIYADCSRYQIYAPVSHSAEFARPSRRVLLITHDLSLSGAPMVVLEVARYFQRNGYGVCVVSPRDGKLRACFERDGIPVVVDEWILDMPRQCSRSWGPFDLMVANTVLGWKCIQEAARLKKPNVFLVHESDFGVEYIESQGTAAERAFSDADAVVFPSTSTVHLYEKYRGAAPYVEIRYGINDVAQAAEPSHSDDDDRVVVVHSGTVEPRKGQDLLVAAVRRLPASVRDRIEVRLVGRDDDPNRADFVTRVKREAQGLPVRFCGELPRAEALAHLAGADVFVCASTEETGPLVVYEAMALGKPVITTRVGAAMQVVAEGESGYVIDVGDVEALCERLTRLVLAGRNERVRLGRAGRIIFEEQHTIDKYGARLEALFESVLAAREQSVRTQAPARAA